MTPAKEERSEMSDSEIIDSMRRYYDERAGEYDELYDNGGGPASISSQSAYLKDVIGVSEALTKSLHADVLDLACGTAYWLQYYHSQCDSITLVDQSPKMIEETRKRVCSLGVESKTTIIEDDVFSHKFAKNAFDCVMVGFLLSHLEDLDESRLFGMASHVLRPSGSLTIVDSVWSEERARTHKKNGTQIRILNDGREFRIHKHYFDRSAYQALGAKHGVRFDIVYYGRVFTVARATIQ
jgi:ubiquinone/menaquinone biosynthesis C-methylase UbiE